MHRLRFGLVLTASGAEPVAQVREHTRLLQTAAAGGFDAVTVGQHFLQTDLRYLQPIPYLGYLSAIAPSVRVGTGILLLPLLHPIEVAEQVATLDVLSGGKAVLGVGLGYSDLEFEAFGIDRRTRAARFEESVARIRALWGQADVPEGDRYCDVGAARGSAPPHQNGGPPIWVAGQTPAAVRRAARIGDAWYVPPFPSHSQLRTLRTIFSEERAASGQPPEREFPVRRELYIAATSGEAARLVIGAARGRLETYVAWGMQETRDVDPGFATPAAAELGDRFILGPPEHCAEQLAALVESLGMTTFMLKVQWPGMPFEESLRQLELFIEGVLPHFDFDGN